MRTLSKLLPFMLLTILIVSLAACGDVETKKAKLDPNNPVQITFWHYYADENRYLLEEMIDDFNETVGLEKGIVVKPIAQGSIAELENAITSSANGEMNSQEMPNIFSSYIDKAVEMDSMGKIIDLNGYFTQEDKKNYLPAYIESSTSIDGRMLIVPVLKSTEVLYINRTDMEKFLENENLDIDMLSTWEGVEKLSEKYHTSKLLSSSANPESANAFFGFDDLANFIIIGMKQQGVDVINADIKGALLDKEALGKVFDLYIGNIVNGNFYESGRFRTDNVKTGDILSYVGSSSGASYFPACVDACGKTKDIDLTVLPYPHFDEEDSCFVQQGAGTAVVKSEDPLEIEASVEFLKWFTSYEQNMRIALKSGYLPVAAKAYEEGNLAKKLDEMKSHGGKDRNTALVFEVGIKQMMSKKTYVSKPFYGSYEIRKTLTSTLKEIKDLALQQAKSGIEVDYDKYFDDWIADIEDHLNKSNVTYKEVN